MTFKVCNLGSKRPHLHRAYVLGVYNNLGTTVGLDLSIEVLQVCRSRGYKIMVRQTLRMIPSFATLENGRILKICFALSK